MTLEHDTSIEYKYVIVSLNAEKKKKLLRFENFEGSRKIVASGALSLDSLTSLIFLYFRVPLKVTFSLFICFIFRR